MSDSTIKSMKLYSQVDRIYNDLAGLGIAADEPLSVDTLSPFDNLHYFGTQSVDETIREAGIAVGTRVLDIGSGLGGPARYLADRTGCSVRAVELQPDMSEVAASLTARCGLSGHIEHVCDDALETPLADNAFDAAVSWLAIYHIRDRARLFNRLSGALRPGGSIAFEDLYSLGPFSARDQNDMDTMLYGMGLTGRAAYIRDLEQAGFTHIRFHDMTQPWTTFTQQRLAAFRANRNAQVKVHGTDVVAALDDFYATVVRLFESGSLGGVRVSASLPAA